MGRGVCVWQEEGWTGRGEGESGGVIGEKMANNQTGMLIAYTSNPEMACLIIANVVCMFVCKDIKTWKAVWLISFSYV